MKKITLLLAFVACAVFASAQDNLLVNPDFETWAGGVPTGWTIVSATNGACSQETNFVKSGTSSFKVTGGTGTYTVNQSVPVVAGKRYTITMKYYIDNGDGTDARIWCNFKTAAGAYWKMNLNDSLAMKGPNATATGGYFPDVRGSYQTYTYEVVAPVGYELLAFEFRTYKSPAVVYWDNMSLVEKTTGLSTPKASTLEVLVSGKNLLVKNVVEGSTVEIFSAVGSKVQTSAVENGKVSIANLKGGMYVVRSGKLTQKIML